MSLGHVISEPPDKYRIGGSPVANIRIQVPGLLKTQISTLNEKQ